MAKYDVVRIENRAGGYSEHLGEINAPTLESAQDRASVEYECPESCRLVVSECESEETPAKHTPGPWRAACRRGYAAVFAGDQVNARAVADCRTVDMELPEATANAKLIAAAPELLEALESMLATSRQIRNGQVSASKGKAEEIAAAALRKARGE